MGTQTGQYFLFVLKSNTVSAPFLQALSVEYKYEKICLLVLAIWGEVWGKNPIQHRQEIKLSVPRFAVKTARKRPAEKIVCKTFKNLWDVHKQRSLKQKKGLNRLGNKVSSSWKCTRNKITAISPNFDRKKRLLKFFSQYVKFCKFRFPEKLEGTRQGSYSCWW